MSAIDNLSRTSLTRKWHQCSRRDFRFALENRRSCHLMLPKRDHQGTFAWRTRDVGVSGILFDLTYINTSTALYQFSVSNVDAAALRVARSST